MKWTVLKIQDSLNKIILLNLQEMKETAEVVRMHNINDSNGKHIHSKLSPSNNYVIIRISLFCLSFTTNISKS